jgi:hypothetical protein
MKLKGRKNGKRSYESGDEMKARMREKEETDAKEGKKVEMGGGGGAWKKNTVKKLTIIYSQR